MVRARRVENERTERKLCPSGPRARQTWAIAGGVIFYTSRHGQLLAGSMLSTLKRMTTGSKGGDGMLSSHTPEAQDFEFRISGDEDHVFGCTLPAKCLKEQLGSMLLEPFLQKMMTDLKIKVACTRCEVNGACLSFSDLERPINDFCTPGEKTPVNLTVYEVSKVEAARLRKAGSPSERVKVGIGSEGVSSSGSASGPPPKASSAKHAHPTEISDLFFALDAVDVVP